MQLHEQSASFFIEKHYAEAAMVEDLLIDFAFLRPKDRQIQIFKTYLMPR